MTTPTSTTNNRSRRGFTYAELMLVIVILAMAAGITGVYYTATWRKTALTAAARHLLLTGKYARLRAVEDGQACRLFLDRENKAFFLSASMIDPVTQSRTTGIVSNPYCRRTLLGDGLAFESIDISPATRRDEGPEDDADCITFYPDGGCDAAVVQLGNGRHSLTAVFSSAYAKVEIFEGTVETVQPGLQVIDLDMAGAY